MRSYEDLWAEHRAYLEQAKADLEHLSVSAQWSHQPRVAAKLAGKAEMAASALSNMDQLDRLGALVS